MISFLKSHTRNLRIVLVLSYSLIIATILVAKPATKYLSYSSSFQVPHPVKALSISADEALIAVAMDRQSGSIIQLYDRQSTKPIARITLDNTQIRSIEFNPRQRQLAVRGSQGLQLWNLENLPNQPDISLSPKNLIWKYEAKEVPQIQFSRQKESLRWAEGLQLKELSLRSSSDSPKTLWTGSSNNPKTLWTGSSNNPINRFAFDPLEQLLAISYKNENDIHLFQMGRQQKRPELDYHFFPIVDLHFSKSNVVISLDKERNMVWGHTATRVKVHGPVLKGISKNETTLEVQPIYEDQFFLIKTQSQQTNQNFAYVIEKSGNMLKKFSLVTENGTAVSPTGAFIAISNVVQNIEIYKTNIHQSPRDYIRQLNNMGAVETARHYRNHLDQRALQLSSGKTSIQVLLENLKTVEAIGQWSKVKHWIAEILKQEPKNSEALQALERLEQNQDFVLLEEGQKALEESDETQAIRLLVQISKNSKYYEKARELIKIAEKQVQIELKLQQAQHEMKRKRWAGAKALLKQVLEHNPTQMEAQALLDEIEGQDMLDSVWNIFTVLVGIGVLTGFGIFLFHRREKLLNWLAMEESQEESSLKPPLRKRAKAQSETFETTPEEKYFLETLTKTKQVLKLTKAQDMRNQHTARLLDYLNFQSIKSSGNPMRSAEIVLSIGVLLPTSNFLFDD